LKDVSTNYIASMEEKHFKKREEKREMLIFISKGKKLKDLGSKEGTILLLLTIL